MDLLTLAVSAASLAVSATTAWLTLGRRGDVRMAQPPSIYLGPDGVRENHPKVFVRALLYSTAQRSHIVEGMFVRLQRGDSVQSFSVWVSGEGKDDLTRSAGLAVTAEGVALHHHFLLPSDGTTYAFVAGAYRLDVFAVVTNRSRPIRLCRIDLVITDAHAAKLSEDQQSGLYFDWSPETGRYYGHIKNARLPESLPSSTRLLAALAAGAGLANEPP